MEELKPLDVDNDGYFEIVEEKAEELVQLYEDSANAAYWLFSRYASSSDFFTRKKTSALLSSVRDRINRFLQKAKEDVVDSIDLAADAGMEEALAELEDAGWAITMDREAMEKSVALIAAYAADVAADALQAQATSMVSQVSQEARRMAIEVSRQASISGRSLRETAGGMDAMAITFMFRDRASRRWPAEKYISVLSRASQKTANREAKIAAMIAAGCDLAMISSHGAPDRCGPWEGRVISLTGATEGYPTYADSRASGDIWHPNCRHRLIPIRKHNAVQGED